MVVHWGVLKGRELDMASSMAGGQWAPRTQDPHVPHGFMPHFLSWCKTSPRLKPHGEACRPALPPLPPLPPPPPGMLPVATAMLPANLTPSRNRSTCPQASLLPSAPSPGWPCLLPFPADPN